MTPDKAQQRAERLYEALDKHAGCYDIYELGLPMGPEAKDKGVALIAAELLAVQRECADKLEAMIPEKGLSRRSGRYKWLSYAAQAIRGETK